MIWGRKNRSERHRETSSTGAEKTASPVSSAPSFQLSDFFSFSWISRAKREKQSSIPKPDSPPANPKRFPPSSSDQSGHVAGDAPRRRSTGDDENRRRFPSGPRREPASISCSARHFSLGELELRPISGYWDWDLDPPPKKGETRPRGQRMRPKVKVRSPRAAARRRAEERKGGWRSLERFATVKMSSDPEKDFRESMVEMIREKRMRRPEEMKRLLDCYIKLNADDHHGLILKAFRQVWLDLNPFWLAGGGCGCHCCQFCESC